MDPDATAAKATPASAPPAATGAWPIAAPTVLDGQAPESTVAAFVDEIRADPARRQELVALLSERHPLYEGRGTNATVRLRGYLLASFEATGLPDEALPYLLEELESGREAYLVAAAARGLRSFEAPTASLTPYLLRAHENLRYADDTVSFAGYSSHWPAPDTTTALREVLLTLAWLGPRARSALPALEALDSEPSALSAPARSALGEALAAVRRGGEEAAAEGEGPCCCASPGHDPVLLWPSAPARASSPVESPPVDILLEDQDGRRVTYGEIFTGRPAVVAFFYTRCANPRKCPLTIAKLAHMVEAQQVASLSDQLTLAAISYDPDFDLPPRLRAYGENLGFRFGNRSHLLRTPADFPLLGAYFQLAVSYGPALVSRHAIELFLLDHEGRIAERIARREWDPDEVLERARGLADRT